MSALSHKTSSDRELGCVSGATIQALNIALTLVSASILPSD